MTTSSSSKTTLDDFLRATSRSRAVAANRADDPDATVVTATGTGADTDTDTDTDTGAVAGEDASDATALATSQEVRDRGSTFVGYVYRAKTTEEARAVVGWHGRRCRRQLDREGARDRHRHVNEQDKGDDAPSPTPYTIAAWRCMVVKPGRTGLGGPDEFEVEGGSDDGGERYAGKRVLGVMQREGVIDAVVIVSRWFGGTLLGPVRFTHVDTCASEVCRRFKKVEEMEEYVQTLTRLDNVLATLRAKWATTLAEGAKMADPSSSRGVPDNLQPKSKAPDYCVMQRDLDLTKAKRLIHARECAIQNTKALIEKYKTSI